MIERSVFAGVAARTTVERDVASWDVLAVTRLGKPFLLLVGLVALVNGCGPKNSPSTASPTDPGPAASTETPASESPTYQVGELPPLQATPTSKEDLARVEAHRQAEVQPFVNNPAFEKSLRSCMAALPNEDPFAVGQALAIEVISMGFPLLSDEDLLRWSEIRRALARTSRDVCSQTWVGSLGQPHLDTALASVDDAMARDFFRLRALAGNTAVANPGSNAPGQIERVREALAQLLGAEAWGRVSALLERPQLSSDEACFLEEAVFGGLASLEPATHAALVRELYATTAAVPSVLPAACFAS